MPHSATYFLLVSTFAQTGKERRAMTDVPLTNMHFVHGAVHSYFCLSCRIHSVFKHVKWRQMEGGIFSPEFKRVAPAQQIYHGTLYKVKVNCKT